MSPEERMGPTWRPRRQASPARGPGVGRDQLDGEEDPRRIWGKSRPVVISAINTALRILLPAL